MMKGKKFPQRTLPVDQIVLNMFRDKEKDFFESLLTEAEGMTESEVEAYIMFREMERKLERINKEEDEAWNEPLSRLQNVRFTENDSDDPFKFYLLQRKHNRYAPH